MNVILTTPDKLKLKDNEQRLQKIAELIEKEFKNYSDGDWKQCVIVISGEPDKEDRDEIAKRYVEEAGWKKVIHRTSSENNERPGLTRFTFIAP